MNKAVRKKNIIFLHSPRVFLMYIGKTLPLSHGERGKATLRWLG